MEPGLLANALFPSADRHDHVRHEGAQLSGGTLVAFTKFGTSKQQQLLIGLCGFVFEVHD